MWTTLFAAKRYAIIRMLTTRMFSYTHNNFHWKWQRRCSNNKLDNNEKKMMWTVIVWVAGAVDSARNVPSFVSQPSQWSVYSSEKIDVFRSSSHRKANTSKIRAGMNSPYTIIVYFQLLTYSFMCASKTINKKTKDAVLSKREMYFSHWM